VEIGSPGFALLGAGDLRALWNREIVLVFAVGRRRLARGTRAFSRRGNPWKCAWEMAAPERGNFLCF
jgi:hypothetical protein